MSAEGRHGAASPSALSKMHTCSKVILCIRLFTVNLISRKKTVKQIKYKLIKYANILYILFFCKKICGQDLKSGHLLEIEKK